MSSQFLTFIFLILVSVQLSSCLFFWSSPKEKTKAAIESEQVPRPPKNLPSLQTSTINSDLNDDQSTSASTVKPPTAVEALLERLAVNSENHLTEVSTPFSTGKETELIPKTSSSSSDITMDYTSSIMDKITDSSTAKISTESSTSESSTSESSTSERYSSSKTTTALNTGNIQDSVANSNYGARDVANQESGNSDDTFSEKNSTISTTTDGDNIKNNSVGSYTEVHPIVIYADNPKSESSSVDEEKEPTSTDQPIDRKDKETHAPRDVINDTESYDNGKSEAESDLNQSSSTQTNTTIKPILSTSTDTMMNTTEMTGSMSNGTTPEVNFGSFINSGSTSNAFSQLIFNLCILIFSTSVIV